MSLYPSLEDMKVDHMVQAQLHHQAITSDAQMYPPQAGQIHQVYPPQGGQIHQMYPPQGGENPTAPSFGAVAHPGISFGTDVSLYPSLSDYMGLDITQHTYPQALDVDARSSDGQMQVVAPVTGNSVGLRRAEVKQGVRQVVCCKDDHGKIGLRVRIINGGVFIALVCVGSPAALSGLRFGDQLLQLNGETLAGYGSDKVMSLLKQAPPQRITFVIRDRPFERTITLQKDSHGYVGFVYKGGRIKSIAKDSSAARNGLLTDHQVIEIDGVNMVAVKDSAISAQLAKQKGTITLTIMPCFIYEHMIKCMGTGLMQKSMDHSTPDV